MILDFSQSLVSPQIILYGETVFTDLPTNQADTYSHVLLPGTTTSSVSLGGTPDDEE